MRACVTCNQRRHDGKQRSVQMHKGHGTTAHTATLAGPTRHHDYHAVAMLPRRNHAQSPCYPPRHTCPQHCLAHHPSLPIQCQPLHVLTDAGATSMPCSHNLLASGNNGPQQRSVADSAPGSSINNQNCRTAAQVQLCVSIPGWTVQTYLLPQLVDSPVLCALVVHSMWVIPHRQNVSGVGDDLHKQDQEAEFSRQRNNGSG